VKKCRLAFQNVDLITFLLFSGVTGAIILELKKIIIIKSLCLQRMN
jgi:hypothetical protein